MPELTVQQRDDLIRQLQNGVPVGNQGQEPAALDMVKRELATMGGNVAELFRSVQADLQGMRTKLDNDLAKGDVSALVREQLNAATTGILEKISAIETKQGEQQTRADEMEAAAKRIVMGVGPGRGADEVRDAVHAWNLVRWTAGGHSPDRPADPQLFARTEVTDQMVELYRQYEKGFSSMFRGKGNPTLGDIFMRTGMPIQHRDIFESSMEDGGLFIPTIPSGVVVKRIYEMDPIRGEASQETISGKEWLGWQDADQYEAAGATEVGPTGATTTPKWGEYRIPVHPMRGVPRVSVDMLDDSGFNIEQHVMNGLGERFGRLEGQWFVTGTGVDQACGLWTFYTYSASAASWAGPKLTFLKVKTGSATGVTYEGLTNIMTALQSPYDMDAKWWMRRASLAGILQVQDGGGRYVFAPLMVNPTKMILTIWGQEIKTAPNIPAYGSNNLAIGYGSMKETYKIIDRTGITVLRNPYSDENYVKFVGRKRVGGAAVNPDSFVFGYCSA